MPYTIVVHFDTATDAKIRGLWQVLLNHQILVHPHQRGYAPHLTMGSCADTLVGEAFPLLDAFAARTTATPITLYTIGVFPSKAGVVYLGPVVTHSLLDFHANFQRDVGRHLGSQGTHNQVGHWSPHCTLGNRLDTPTFVRAVELLFHERNVLPFRGLVSSLALYDMDPRGVRVVHESFFVPVPHG